MKKKVISLSLSLLFFQIFASTSFAEPTYSSVEERRLEQNLIQNAQENELRLSTLVARENELKMLQTAVDKKLIVIDQKIALLQKKEAAVKELLRKKSATEKKRLEGLAKIYEKMNVQKAAAALAVLDSKLASSLVSTMKAKAAAKILEQLPASTASQITINVSGTQLTLPD